MSDGKPRTVLTGHNVVEIKTDGGNFKCLMPGCGWVSLTQGGVAQHMTRSSHWPPGEKEKHDLEVHRRKAVNTRPESTRKKLVAAGKRPRVSPNMKNKLVKMIDSGYSVRAAAEQLGISYRTALRKKKEAFADPGRPVPPLSYPPKPYDELSAEAKKRLENFGEFRRYYFNRESPPWGVEAAHQMLELYYSEVEEYVVINLPPGAGKTTLFTHDFVVWVVCRERSMGREPRIQLGARAGGMAVRYVGRVRHSLTFNARLIHDFGRFKAEDVNSPWSREELLVEPLEWDRLVEKEPTVSASSQEMGFQGGRFSIAIWDDLVDKYNSRTIDARQALIDIFETEAESRLEPGGLFMLQGSRYGPADLYSNRLALVDIEEADDDGEPKKLYRHITYQAHYDELCNGREHTGPYPGGCLLDPTRLPWRKLRRAQATNESRYRLIYQQEDVDPAGFLADPKWFIGGRDGKGWEAPGCLEHELLFGQNPREGQRPLISAITADPGPSRYWGIMHFLHYEDGKTYIYRGVRRPMTAPELLYQEQGGQFTGILEDWWQASKDRGLQPTYVIVEVNAAQKFLLQYPFVRTWSQSRGVVIVPHTTTINKTDPELGIQTLGPIYREGRLRFPYAGFEEKTFADQFAREACSWPEGASDDLPQAHWFFAFHLPRLQIAEMQSDFIDDNLPKWATVTAPKWARERLTSAGKLP